MQIAVNEGASEGVEFRLLDCSFDTTSVGDAWWG
jgi:hypothetical protein